MGLPSTTYSSRRNRGLCTTCGSPVEGDLRNRVTGKKRVMCRSCLKYNADKLAGYRRDRREKGLCQRCGKRPSKPGIGNCEPCATKVSATQKRHRDSHFFDKKARSVSIRLYFAPLQLARILWSLWKGQRGLCALTGRRLTRYNAHLDHKIPVSRGGTNERSNLRWVVKEANQAKHSLLDSELRDLCKDILRATNELS